MDAITLVAANPADLAIVRDLAREIWHRHYPGIISVAQIEYMLARGFDDASLGRFLSAPGAGLVLAREAAAVVAFAAWHRADVPATTKLDKLYVLPDRHGRGIGRRLIAHVEAAARADGARQVVLNVNKHNATAIAAYGACGYAVRDAVTVDIGGGFVMDDFVMERTLAAAGQGDADLR